MLTYLILVTRAAVAPAALLGALAGYCRLHEDKLKRIIYIAGAIAGLLLSIWMSYYKNTNRKIDTGYWNSIIYETAITAFLVFMLLSVIPVISENKIAQTVSFCAMSVCAAMAIFYSMPDVWAYPYQILLSEKTVISTDFLLGMIGLIAGLLLCVVIFFAVYKCSVKLTVRQAFILATLEILTVCITYLAGLFSVFLQKRIIISNHTIFSFVVFVKNHSDWFIYLSMLMPLVAAVMLFIKSFSSNEKYENPAQHRKLRAAARRVRRWAAVCAVSFALVVLNLTIVDAANSKEVTLSPVEETTFDDENVYVSFDQVEDGHLHRFSYISENDTEIRFIVIQKPNSSSYGIGLDACDVCGETGYYERDGQVVCKLCDVVMNISTIGFKGGCNPIVIPYEIKDGQIIVPISGLLEYESEFK